MTARSLPPRQLCAACGELVADGEPRVDVPLGPGKDAGQRKNAREGRPYLPVFALLHRACADGVEDDGDVTL